MGKAILTNFWMCHQKGIQSFQKIMCVKARSSISAAKKIWRCHKHLKKVWVLCEETQQIYEYDTSNFLKLKKEHQLKRRQNKKNE